MNQSKTQTTRQNSPNSNLVKQILDCCKMLPVAPALNLVPQATVLRAARKVGLVGDYNQLRWCQRRIEQFIAECFLQVAEQHKAMKIYCTLPAEENLYGGDDML